MIRMKVMDYIHNVKNNDNDKNYIKTEKTEKLKKNLPLSASRQNAGHHEKPQSLQTSQQTTESSTGKPAFILGLDLNICSDSRSLRLLFDVARSIILKLFISIG